jgi:hypothetical protein
MDEALDIVREQGLALTSDDLLAIDLALVDVPIDQHFEARGRVMSGVAQIVMQPEYEGDIDLNDLTDE